MVYCDQDMCESKLGKLMQAFRADRPSEWQMDEFIGMVEQMHKVNQDLIDIINRVIDTSKELKGKTGTSSWTDGYKECAIDTGSSLSTLIEKYQKENS